MTPDDYKALEKINQLLKLARSPNAGERVAATRAVRKLLDRWFDPAIDQVYEPPPPPPPPPSFTKRSSSPPSPPPPRRDRPAGAVWIDDVGPELRETDLAYLFEIEGHEVWVPKSMIVNDEDREENDPLLVKRWWAIKAGVTYSEW